MIDYKNQRVGVFIDVQNMYYSARNLFNQKVNFGNVVKKAAGDRQLIRAVAYVVSTKTGENQPFFDALAKIGIETKEKELMEYYGGQKKADWDVGITVDAIRLSENLDVIILVSGDGDYIPLVEYLRSHGKIVEVASFRETTSTRLVEAIGDDHYTNLSENKRSFLIPERRTLRGRKQTPKIEPGSTGGEISKSGEVLNEMVETVAPSPAPAKKAPARRAPRKPQAPRARAHSKSSASLNDKPGGAGSGSAGVASSQAPHNDRSASKSKTRGRSTPTKNTDDGLSANERALNN